jgi:two-component system, cell cycle sensor histidine kinase and response regulator CckA
LIPVVFFLLSIGLQLTAAIVALLLVRTTGRKLAWLLLSLAMLLMAWRRTISFISLLASGKTITFEFPEYIALTISVLMLVGVVRIGTYFRSISLAEEERKLTWEKLKESEKKFRNVFDNAFDGILIVDIATKQFLFGNTMICKMLGYDEQEISNLHVQDIHPEKDLPYVLEQLEKQAKEEIVIARNIPVKRKDGGVFYADISASPLTIDNKACLAGIFRDMTERIQTERYIRELSIRQEAILASVPDIIMEVDNQKIYTWANRAGYEFFGRDVVGKEAAFYFEGEQDTYTLVEPLFKGTEDIFYVESRQRRKDGEKRLLAWWCRVLKDESGNVKGALSTARDITEYRKLEEQILQKQKMESIGTFAGGVAHDFNNILQTIIGYGNIALINMGKNDPQRLNIEHILEGADRAAHLTKELLLFSRKQIADKKPVDLNTMIRKSEKFLRRIIGEDIDFRTELNETTMPVLADSHQIEQVLMNLAANSRDAMPKGGTFTVKTEQINLKEDFTLAHGFGKPGPYAMITVSDTGMGMDENTLKRIFEPFFTTKEVGRGTGLGLAVVYGIIKQHDGFIDVYSEPDKGFTFRIYLPIIASAVVEDIMAHHEEAPAYGTETVLVAEDDEITRKLSSTVLAHYGYTVIEAVDGEDALRKFRENKETIQLLLFDLIMPKMNGKEAYDEILKIKPDIKVIFASGYAPDIVRQKVSLENGAHLIYKPVSPFEVLRKVRNVLDN